MVLGCFLLRTAGRLPCGPRLTLGWSRASTVSLGARAMMDSRNEDGYM